MATNKISYPIYSLSTRIKKGYTNEIIPFFFCSVYKFDRIKARTFYALIDELTKVGSRIWLYVSPEIHGPTAKV